MQDGRQQTISLGRYPDFSLAEAREWREEVRRKRAHGENVVNKKVRADFAFEKVARDWFVRWSKGRSEKYAGQVMRNFERWFFRLSAILISVKSGRRTWSAACV